ncbi:GH92 family glycosyl hydrolase [Labilibaculum euxinus]|uniref:Glycoside hydrolase family 92 protein n=1 Tax=Labilibaculum euxinus TaxID=2686357 RepID=A0A7M4D4I6_9BACT|nr:GH92 family glycosyl hydrolase [Labilibaculum euxinus]MUP37565.1 glycoside hydrolase family 92 protein [Labilibaculum euxinus]MVB06770.1 glycoside hydrolase family 92 protein [Labilibaculum euxinus]
MKNRINLIFMLTLMMFLTNHLRAQSLSKLVNPLIGSEGDGLGCGYCFIGATYPFGMVQFSPGFFTPQHGFAITQLSGAGCANMGNFPVLPLSGILKKSPNDMDEFTPYQKVNEVNAGYLSVSMEDNTLAELTVNKRSGIAKFTFDSNNGTVLIGSGINATFVENAAVEITSPSTCEGFSYGGDFCGAETRYTIYFAAEFDRDANQWGTWMKGNLLHSAKRAYGKKSGAYFTFDTNEDKEVEYRIAISFVSVENARENLKKSATQNSFEAYRNFTAKVWDANLGKIKVKSDSQDELRQFYTHLYHTLIHPNIVSDSNGEFIGADYQVHQVAAGHEAYSSFSVWDTYRTQAQLLAMLYPREAGDMMQSLVEFADQAGGYGRWILANIETGIMQGDPTSILIANSYAFGATNFDAQKAFDFMKKGATIPHLYSQDREIRPFLKEYNEVGIAPASILLEYTAADYAIGEFARQSLHNESEAEFFINRSENWKNLYNPQLNWLCSRHKNGKWKSIKSDWREASYKNYFWMVPYDLETLIDTIGGKRAAEKRLDSLFVRLDASYDDDWFAAGNEPDFQIPWIYNWTDSPSKTNKVLQRIFHEVYNSSSSGLPGNDDLGAMGAWYVFASVGLYPMVPGVGGFSINIPRFSNVNIELPGGNLSITGGSKTASKIKSLRLNTKKHEKYWIKWNEIKNGGKIDFSTAQ